MSIWNGLPVVFLGGDEREAEMAMMASQEGAEVRVFGTPAVSDPSAVLRPATLAQALAGAQVAVGSIVPTGSDGRLFAPSWPEPIVPRAADLAGMRSPAHIVIGAAGDQLAALAAEVGITVHEYEPDTELRTLRGPAVAEGAIRVAIEDSPLTIHGSSIGVVGFGRSGRALTLALLGLRARVHVFARRAEARAEAMVVGAEAHPIEDMRRVFPQLDIVYGTVPVTLLTEDLLRSLRPGTLVVDTAAPPGSVDHDAAERLGLPNRWARGLGASAPRTVGGSQWMGVTRIVEAALG